MRKILLFSMVFTFLWAQVSISQILNRPVFSFTKKLYGIKPKGPALPADCKLDSSKYGIDSLRVFGKIAGRNPLQVISPDSVFWGTCSSFKSTTFPDSNEVFRLYFSESSLKFVKKFPNKRTKMIYTNGEGAILRKNGLDWDTILLARNFTVFLNAKVECIAGIYAPFFDGQIIGDIDTLASNQNFIKEFINYSGSNQIRGFFKQFNVVIDKPTFLGGVFPFEANIDIVPMPINNQANIYGQYIPGIGSQMNFGNSASNGWTKLKFNSFLSMGDTSAFPPSVTVCHYPWEDTLPAKVNRKFANIFDKFWWLVGSNLDSLNAEMCFKFNPKKLKLDSARIAKYLSVSWQDSTGTWWNRVPITPSVNMADSTICFTIDHFSNWTIALDKPQNYYSDTTRTVGNGTIVSKSDTLIGYSLDYLVPNNAVDTVVFEKYDMEPGGEIALSDTNKIVPQSMDTIFYELYSNNAFDGRIGFDNSNISNKTAILYRPSAVEDWTVLPATRVKRGMKEALYVRPSNKNGQYATAEAKTVSPEYTATISATDACLGDSTKFTTSVSGGVAPYTYSWNFGDGSTSALEAPSYKYAKDTSYNCTLVATDANMVELTYIKSVTVKTSPVVNFTNQITAPYTVQFNNQSTGAGNLVYLWNFGDGTEDATQNPVHKFDSSNTSYSVKLTVTSSNGCSSFQNNAVVTVGVGEDLVSNNGLFIFPNPNANAYFNILYHIQGSSDLNVSVTDVLGKVVYKEVIKNITDKFEKYIDLSKHPKGLYLIKILDGNKMVTEKMLYQ